jgi:glutamyl-tRNA synthetase
MSFRFELERSLIMVRTRIAPSPTGEDLHIGNVYTALLNFAWAKRNSGKFILRIEDTDRSRLVEDAEEKIKKSLEWFRITYDEGPDIPGPFEPYRQSERLEIYKKHALELVEKGHAFYCFCSSERLSSMRSVQEASGMPTIYDGFCKKFSPDEALEKAKSETFVIRMNTPEDGKTSFEDLVRGEIEFENRFIDDQILLKSDGYPTYHLGVVVDDHLMEISHVIRAEEWISSTPKHVLLYQFFGWDLPYFAHVPILRNPDKSKLSKRKNPVWVSWYKKEGFLPEAIINFLALMGWSHPDQKEKFDISEFISLFDPKDLKAVGPIFDITKLEWLNGLWIREMSKEELQRRLEKFYSQDSEFSAIFESKHIGLLVGLAQSRMKKLSEFRDLVNAPQNQREFSDGEKEAGKKLLSLLESINHTDWREDTILNHLKNFRDQENVSMKTIYFIITGKEQGLPLIETMVKIEGREQILENLRKRIS